MVERKIVFVEDGVKKYCIERILSDSSQWFGRFKANVQTHSFHMTSGSTGQISVHRDDLSGDGSKDGLTQMEYLSHSEQKILGTQSVSCSAGECCAIFPKDRGLTILTMGSNSYDLASSEGTDVIVVKFRGPLQ